MSEPIRVIVADDHPIFCSGVVELLKLDDGIEVVDKAHSGAEAIEAARQHRPDVLLLDITMQDNGLDVIEPLLAASPNTFVVMLTASEQQADITRALAAGAVGYVLKGVTGRELISVVHDVHSGRVHISPRALGNMLSKKAGDSEQSHAKQLVARLSPQEERVLRLVAQGFNNREIGLELTIQEKTVKFHLANVFRKIEVRNRVEASLLATRAWPSRH